MFSITQHDVELSRPIVILGAGLSGLSLADALVERGCRAPIVLVDRRRRWTNDRTWCTWLTGPLRHAELARHRWWSWQLRRGGDAVIAHARAHPYIQIEAATLYDRVLTRLQGLPGVEIRTGERVRALHPGDDGPIVDTDRERLQAVTVVDALGSSSPLRGTPSGAELALSQRLLGWEIETERPVFDPRMATLMDFTSAGPSGVEFVYRLPFDATHALVEHTSIGRGGPDADVRRAALTHDCDRLAGPGAWRIVREEHGVIPMTTARFPRSHGPRTFTVGGAAGAVRPSSGYAFTRIQRHVETVADAIIAGDDPPASVAPARLQLLDRMFLTALRDAPDGGEDLFWRLGRSVDADAFARFMTDVSSPWDELRIARALPPLRMLAAGARSLR